MQNQKLSNEAHAATSRKVLGISLSEGVKPRHLLAYLLVALISSGYAGAMAVLQPGLLQVLNIPFDQQGSVTGLLSALQEIVFISLLGVIGVVADKIGRRVVYCFGLAVTALGFCLYPYAENLTGLILFRLVVAVGGAAMVGMMVTVIADYAQDKDRGKANGLQGLVATVGAFIPPMLALLPKYFVGNGMTELEAQQATFAAAGALGALGVVIAWVGLSATAGKVTSAHGDPLITRLKQGLLYAKQPKIALSYGAAFISRGDLAVTGAFMGLWLVQFGTLHLNMQPSQAMAELAMPRILTTVCGAAVGAIFMGLLSDKISRVNAVSIAAGLAAMVYLTVFFVSDPTALWVFGLLGVMGVAEISAFVSSQALIGEQAPAEHRGSVIGFFGVSGAIGILVGTAFGGILFQSVGPSAPFVLFGVLNLVVFIWSLMVSRSAGTDKNTGQEMFESSDRESILGNS